MRDRLYATVNSALWAAAGDALGWISELTDEKGLKRRIGQESVSRPVDWERIVGGRYGVSVQFRAGTYSDDTQLRLAVCRSIRGNGIFDVEAFAKVELPTWLSYALGAGRGTKAAASNLAKRDVNWFSNFFLGKEQDYLQSGGNGAAMRVQPHVWACIDSRNPTLDVLRDAVVTHGHPHGFCGAIFHSHCLRAALLTERAPGPDEWHSFIEDLAAVPDLLVLDGQLTGFWLPAWERAAGLSFRAAVTECRDEAHRDLRKIDALVRTEDPHVYPRILAEIGCLEPQYRGSGLKTAVASAALVWLHRHGDVESALLKAANVLNSDTDTICTMSGAIFGSFAQDEMNWPLQDREYIQQEATRLAKLARGDLQDSFAYPDLSQWSPPANQSSAVGRYGSGLAIAGLGEIIALGREYPSRDATWQWMKLRFGQTVLAKRRKEVRNKLSTEQLPGERRMARRSSVTSEGAPSMPIVQQPTLFFGPQEQERVGSRTTTTSENRELEKYGRKHRDELDLMTDAVIQSNFDDRVLGHYFNRCVELYGSIESAVAFSSVVAKAKIARNKRR